MKIYVPDLNYECYVVYSEDIIRAYEDVPTYNSTVNYRDYYLNSNYVYKDGYSNFGSYSNLPVCLNSDVLTDNVIYRNDFDSILIIFFILVIICFYFPTKIFLRLFRRFN